jgi:ATP-dependent DNA helicase HFM1/MER3
MLGLQHVPRYEQLVTGSETVESALKEMLPEFLNAEIALHTITDVTMAIEWIKGTFFYTRVSSQRGLGTCQAG